MFNLFKRQEKKETKEPVFVLVERTCDQMLMEYLITHPNTDVEILKKDNRKYSDVEMYNVHGDCYKSQEFDNGNTYQYTVYHYSQNNDNANIIFQETGVYNRKSLNEKLKSKRRFTEFVNSLIVSIY